MARLNLTPTRRTARPGRRGAFTLTDLVACLLAIPLVLAVALPALAQNRDRAAMLKCANNLRQIGLAMIVYANNETRTGAFPRARFDHQHADKVTAYTRWQSPDSFGPADPKDTKPGREPPDVNDVTAAFYLVLKTQEITPDVFVCPATAAKPLPVGKQKDPKVKPLAEKVQELSNWPGPQYLTYSYSNPYASDAAMSTGWKFNNALNADWPLVADMNPGGEAVLKVKANAAPADLAKANSPNHGGMGQNVVYADGHVEFQPTPFCGSAVRDDQGNLTKIRDNIYAPEPTAAPPGAKPGDKPAAAATTVMGAPQTAFDAVLLPPADFKPAADPTTAPAKAPGR